MGYPEDALLDFTQLANKYGYYSEKHKVITEDGYILELFRLNSQKCDKLIQPPVLLMHGLTLSSESWLDSGPDSSLAYMLANHCYDVWAGNIRGNFNGRRHLVLNPDKDKKFWDFCVDDHGYYDIPAQIDKILNVTRSQKLNYIGYSQGGAKLAIACIERPQYCDKVEVFVALAPALKMKNTRSIPFRGVAVGIAAIAPFLSQHGIYNVGSKGSAVHELFEYVCQLGEMSATLCDMSQTGYSYNPGSLTLSTLRSLYSHGIAGTSTKTFVKYAQSLQDDDFRKFDYGTAKNLIVYGTEKAPRYKIENMKIPTVIITGLNDLTVDVKDIYWLRDHLPNVIELKIVDDPSWNHFDMIYSQFIPSLVFPIVNKYLSNRSSL